MYHSAQKTQANSSNFSQSSATPEEKPKVPLYDGCIESYLKTCTRFQKKIADKFLQFRYSEVTTFKNETIADELGCSVKTVTRCTNKFHAEGFITKSQENPYAPNEYKFNTKVVKGRQAYEYWFNEQTTKNQALLNTHGARVDHKNRLIVSPRNVPQNTILSYYTKSSTEKPITHSTRAREGAFSAHQEKQEQKFPDFWKTLVNAQLLTGYGLGFKKLPRTDHCGKAVSSYFAKATKDRPMNDTQKQFILQHKDDHRVKRSLEYPSVRKEIITPPIERLTQLLALNEREQLKMVAFPDIALKYALDHVEPIVSGKKKLFAPVRDRMGWVLGILNEYCKNNKITPDWPWYFELCRMSGIEALQKGELPISLKLEKAPEPVYKKATVVREPSDEEMMAKLREDVKGFELQLAAPEAYWDPKSFLFEQTVSATKKFHERAVIQLKELEARQNVKM